MSAPTLGYDIYPASAATPRHTVLDDLTGLVRRGFTRHRVRKDLRHMPDWMLRDIGIERGQIDDVVDRHVDAEGRTIGGYPF